mmetsp:Transcript_27157/g.51144  ORF Transcript_27157/g.51144 Transcript_27157/m.51144 type:complete len:216 (-) Transcript_27157:605-1252(-)
MPMSSGGASDAPANNCATISSRLLCADSNSAVRISTACNNAAFRRTTVRVRAESTAVACRAPPQSWASPWALRSCSSSERSTVSESNKSASVEWSRAPCSFSSSRGIGTPAATCASSSLCTRRRSKRESIILSDRFNAWLWKPSGEQDVVIFCNSSGSSSAKETCFWAGLFGLEGGSDIERAIEAEAASRFLVAAEDDGEAGEVGLLCECRFTSG